ncbi:MAG TPA: S8 family serine peptidase [Gaiellaceae bacterium]|nr:S8 family serine peptidase [Gaiellaceae bacterium]
MRLDRGRYGGLRQSALWGKPSKSETRSSALWGKGGRGFVSFVIVALALTASTAASASSRYAYTTPGLLASAKAHPSQTFNVIIQGDPDKSTGAIASVVKNELRSGERSAAKGIKRQFLSVNGVAANLTGAQILHLVSKNGIAAITTDSPMQLAGTLTNKQRWPFVSGVQKFWANGTSAATPTIAVVDSGIDASRPDFGGRVVAQVNMTSLAGNSAGDGRGHGTFVAGIAAGSGDGYAGAAPASKLVSIDVMDDNGMAMTRDVIGAADWILQNKDKYGIRVANFSLHSSQPNSFMYDPLDQAVERLWFNGVVVVVAAGNYGVDGKPSGVPFAPGNDPFVITVGADDVDGSVSTNDDLAAPWSAYGYTLDGFAKPDVGAPGRFMIGPVPTTSTLVAEKPASVVAPGYIQLSGTSFAAPVVAGAAAQILSAHPTWTPDQVKGALMVTASRTPNAAPLSQGVGIVDVAKAVALSSAPNPNAALNKFVTSDISGGKTFDAASWASTASANASWASASWSDASWASASWSSASWASASWASASWASASWASDSQSAASWASASWASASWADNAETEAPSAEGEYLDEAELAQFAADLGLVDPADTTALPLP